MVKARCLMAGESISLNGGAVLIEGISRGEDLTVILFHSAAGRLLRAGLPSERWVELAH